MLFASQDECGDSLAISTAQREKRLLNGFIQNLLPVVGPHVKSLVLAYGSTVSSKMVRMGAHKYLREIDEKLL